MARWMGCFGSRKQDRGATPRSFGPTSAGEPGWAAEWQLSRFPPDAGPVDAQRPSGLVRSSQPATAGPPSPGQGAVGLLTLSRPADFVVPAGSANDRPHGEERAR